MNTCQDHDDAVVVYDGRYCPFCDCESERDNTTQDLSTAKKRIDALEDEVSGLQADLRQAKLEAYDHRD